EWNRPAFTQVQRGNSPGHSVRTERARYTQWDSGEKGEELYDHDPDAQELHNVAADPQYTPMVAKMKALLKQAHPAPVTGGKAEPRTREKFSKGPGWLRLKLWIGSAAVASLRGNETLRMSDTLMLPPAFGRA